ncbi:MAG TPA: hypothetical protein VNK05_04665 [Chloroflexota bacterium]|nr:hypothetical protein [Chloroflexota bacterium]
MSTERDRQVVDAAAGVLGWLFAHGAAVLVVVVALTALVVVARAGYTVAAAWTDLRLRHRAGDAAGRSGEYLTYLQADAWRARRARTLLLAGGACQRCGRRATDAHHKTYERLGNERDGDREALCGGCHDRRRGR